ncbi:MAG TPA: hypothetical protein PLI18_08240 [Pirellulaceae bacterium]|nr:hypothetical protein [Pirellulaceae bacterium]
MIDRSGGQRWCWACGGLLLMLLLSGDVLAQSALLRSAGHELLQALGRRAAVHGSRAAAEELAEVGGEGAVRALTRRLSAAGGESAVDATARLATEHGPLVIRALDDLPDPLPVLRAVERLPRDQAARSLSRLASPVDGGELAAQVARHGDAVLQVELRHPGLAAPLFRAFDDDAMRLGRSLDGERLLALAQHADEIAALPPKQRDTILGAIRRDAERVAGFLGEFVRANPGKTLATGGGLVLLLAESERILGGVGSTMASDGTSASALQPGLFERLTFGLVRELELGLLLRQVLVTLAAVVGLFAGARWWVRRRCAGRSRNEASSTASEPPISRGGTPLSEERENV